MYKKIISDLKPILDKAIAHFGTEIANLRTGRATSALVEDIIVECYGTKMPIKQIAAIHAPEPRLILIQPWDKSIIKEIEKVIISTRPGLNPVTDGDVIRINLPLLTEERRKELVKLLGQYAESARISIRQIRDEAWKTIQELEKEGQIREDDKFRGKDALQEAMDEYNKKIKDIAEAKEKEIMTI